MYNLFIAIKYVGNFGDDLRSLVSFRPIEHGDSLEGSVHISSYSIAVTLRPDRPDICEYQQLLRRQNGTYLLNVYHRWREKKEMKFYREGHLSNTFRSDVCQKDIDRNALSDNLDSYKYRRIN